MTAGWVTLQELPNTGLEDGGVPDNRAQDPPQPVHREAPQGQEPSWRNLEEQDLEKAAAVARLLGHGWVSFLHHTGTW